MLLSCGSETTILQLKKQISNRMRVQLESLSLRYGANHIGFVVASLKQHRVNLVDEDDGGLARSERSSAAMKSEKVASEAQFEGARSNDGDCLSNPNPGGQSCALHLEPQNLEFHQTLSDRGRPAR